VTRVLIEKNFPMVKRTYSYLDGQELAGGDMLIARLNPVDNERTLLKKLEQGRKHPWRIARSVGMITLVKFLFRKLSLYEVQSTASKMLGRSVRVVISPELEIAMDLDKLEHYEVLQTELLERP
jgi:hypothetical protein